MTDIGITLAVYGAGLCSAWIWSWRRYADPFHPYIFLIPQLLFLYGGMPAHLVVSDVGTFSQYVGGLAGFLQYELLVYLMSIALLGGVLAGSGGRRRKDVIGPRRFEVNQERLRVISLAIGGISWACWIVMIVRVGGFQEAYGTAYGGGWDPSGFIREGRFAGLIGALLIYGSRSGGRMRGSDWALIAYCLAPVALHGLLGARRGPTFVAAVIGAGGYVYFIRRRLSLAAALPAGIALGTLLLFLVANRSDIYFGTELSSLDRSPLDVLETWDSNEYLIGSAVSRYAAEFGSYRGIREVTQLTGRLLPHSIWPAVWDDLPSFFGLDVDLRLNGGIDPMRVNVAAGWMPSRGSAPGFVGDLWIEYGVFALLAAFLIGCLYGTVWRIAAFEPKARLFYLVMTAMSVYLVMQGLDPWLYRILLIGGPCYFLAAGCFRPARPCLTISRRELVSSSKSSQTVHLGGGT
jgi:hypothetical protein